LYQRDWVTTIISIIAIVGLLVASVLFVIDAVHLRTESAFITGSFTSRITFSTKKTKTSSEIQLSAQAPHLAKPVLRAGLRAYHHAEQHHQVKRPILAIVDMALPSSEKRLWVFNMRTHKLVQHVLVAHGKASGTLYARYFSNRINSDATSIGVYQTGKAFVGNDGLSMRLHGLEAGFNSNAYQRDIVLHGAAYVSAAFVKRYHRLGRSWGCPAVSLTKIKSLVKTLQNGALFMIYYPQKAWLQRSAYLH
jgi:hypothetical protein